MTGGIIVLVVIVLLLALFGVITYDLAPLFGFDSRADLPRRPGHARPASPVAGRRAGRAHAAPPAARPAGTAAAVPQARAAAVPLPLPVETPALYNTGELTRLSEHTERWWLS